ncbi:endonuclease [Arthrobacter phage KBurrousTX]|uniref:HNH endonuclease n=1 Tax=Arthrobacter phage KBurrousTX TaxID=2315608 RepID=A0A386K8F7_9CAUD|nr:endonuclease [Arthrobacter phage KBurrousTX]AYD81601.1 HNH endonuclease [Arthrobacter phage KBurrousTX]
MRRYTKDMYPLDLEQQTHYVKDRVVVEGDHHIWQLGIHKVWGYPRGGAPIGFKIAYRAAWEVEHGERLPSDVLIIPTCDRVECVNPAHMVSMRCLPNQVPKMNKARRERLQPATGC